MKHFHRLLIAIGLFAGLGVSIAMLAEPKKLTSAEANKLMQQGNWKEAYEGLKAVVHNPATDTNTLNQDFNHALNCLQNLGNTNQIDDFREEAIKVHAKNWRFLMTAAQSYLNIDHHGYKIAGKFERGAHRGGGELQNAFERDRSRALQIMLQAMPLANADDKKADTAEFYIQLGNQVLGQNGYSEAWRLQMLTDISQLADYDTGWYHGGQSRGAPVDADGKPVLYAVPKSWEAAKNDGERYRWCLMQAAEMNPSRLNETRMSYAGFLYQQFGEQTLGYYGWYFGRMPADNDDDTQKNESGTYALHTLKDNEFIAKLATGIKRFELPDEHNFVKLYLQVADAGKSDWGMNALSTLSQIFQNRRQYPRAAEILRRAIKEYPGQGWKDQLNQIVNNWGRFEPIMQQPAGKGATIEYRYRNGNKVSFEAHELKVPELLADVKAYIKANNQNLDWNKININDFGHRIVHQNEKKYLGNKVASWDLELKPMPNHFDRRITVTTPLQKAGAYLLKATMKDGNTNSIVIWLDDTAIVKKPTDNGMYYFVADAITGEPLAKANLEFFGYRHRHVGPGNKFTTDIRNFAENTDADGQVIRAGKGNENDNEYQWIITATKEGRHAFIGFTGVWYSQQYDQEYNATKVFTITDRPVYRPGNKVKYKFWVRHAQYDQDDSSSFANKNFTVEIHNPKHEIILTKSFTADAYGGFDSEIDLPNDAQLGVYQLVVVGYGGGNFRVEEYKKPEFEVTVSAPTEPVMLGEKITAKINAKYYFGAPVAKGKVKYKIERSGMTKQWYPIAPWDWFYGPGYWWYSYDSFWYPGFRDWGCCRPYPWWFGEQRQPPELVAETELQIPADGKLELPIDTAPAKELHPHLDHEYTITVEVTDESRRVIVGTGKVQVARKPFKVYTWVDRGFYRTGDTIKANFSAQTLDQKPVAGTGKLTLFKISYKDAKPVETKVRDWDLNTNVEGHAELQLKASEAGQYRLSYQVTDEKKHTIEGGYLLTIIGDGFDGAEFRFNDLELIQDKQQYAPGDKVQLQVNTNRAKSTVLLFARPTNGVYLPPKVLRLNGKSTVSEIEIAKRDMPNTFVEALTISSGKVYTETKELIVPPEKRIINVAVEPSAQSYKPGQKGKVKVRLTDHTGENFVGSTVIAIYDKAVEYISGGSNVPEIKEFFWKWRRHHHVNTESSLNRQFYGMDAPNKPGMGNLGMFGEQAIQELDDLTALTGDQMDQQAQFGITRGGGLGGGGPANRRMFKGMALGGAMADGMAMPAAPAMEAAGFAMNEAKAERQDAAPADPGAGPGAALVQPTVRSNFADTALWVGAITTKADGTAEVDVTMPENLSSWKVKVWGMGHGTKVGQGDSEVVTAKDVIVRLQAPRFFIEKDEVVLSANVHNYLKTAKKVTVKLELVGEMLAILDANKTPLTKVIEVSAGGEQRVDWRVKVVREGEALVRMSALTDEDSDAMEQKFPVYVHGMLKMDSYSGMLRLNDTAGKLEFNVPLERRIDQSRLEVRYSPTLAGACVDALPYLVEYPYGCTEQTLNRFVPTVVTQKILQRMGLDLKAIKDKRTNLNAQEIGDPMKRAAGWKRWDRNPVFGNDEVTKMVKDGVERLTQMQLSDGGWGWFSGWGEHSSPHTTAVVVHGLQVAKSNDVALVPGVLEKGIEWLKRYEANEVERLKRGDLVRNKKPGWEKINDYKMQADNLDALVYYVLSDADHKNNAMNEYLYRDRIQLAVYAKAMFGLALHTQKDQVKLDMILRNIQQYVVIDNENQTAYLKLPEDNYWWNWYGSEIEAQSFYLKLLAKTDPNGTVAPQLVKYLLNNRKHATYWNSTRDTSYAIEALADYLKASGEDKPDLNVQVILDGKLLKEIKITAADLFTMDNTVVLEGNALASGKHTLELKKTGKGPLYYNAYVTNFTLEDMITRAGLEVKVNRKFYRLIKEDKSTAVAGSKGQVVTQKVEKYRREELANLGELKSGELLEVELEIDSKNDYEYILFEDLKAAGTEAVEVRSGYNGNSMGAYVEFRDNRVSFFIRALARGKHSVSYRLRAEIPGQFSALPAKASAMYAPELKGNSDEMKLRIVD
jgi:alpha-2-macroglobulin